jgi:polysaccharide biosynthesis protein PslG
MRQFTRGPLRRLGVRLGVAVAAISVVCAGATQFVDATPRSVAMEVVPTAAIVEESTTVGVADSAMYFYNQDQINKTLDALQALGVQNVRIMIPWAGVQVLGPNSYIWQNVDWAVDAANARGMGVLGVLEKTPWWAGTPSYSGHPDPQEYAKWVGVTAERYAGRISAYEIWNEPNSKLFYEPVDAVAYTELLKAAYPVIKAADPSATVVAGVVAALINTGQFTQNPVDFIGEMYAAGAHGYFDALSFHPYSYTLKFSEGAGQAASPLRQLRDIRELMELNGDGNLKVWATEYGQPTSEGSEQNQADFTADFLNFWHTEAGTGPIFLYTTRDIDSASMLPSETLGLFFDNGQPKLVAKVVADFLGGTVEPEPLPPDRPILTAIGNLVRELARITGQAIQFGVDVVQAIAQATVNVIRFLVETTVAVIRGAVDFTVGLVQAGVDLVRDVVDRIGDRRSAPDTLAVSSAGSATADLRATQQSIDAIDAVAQRFSAKAGPVAVGDMPEAATVKDVETGDAPGSGVAAGGQGEATGVDQQEAAPPAAVKPTAAAKPSRGPVRSKQDATLSNRAIKPSQTAKKDEAGSAPDPQPATAGGDGSASDGADNGDSTN